jgi:hypothetical protein
MKSIFLQFFGKANKEITHAFKPVSKQNDKTKTVTQLIADEETVFSYAGFENLKQSTRYDRFEAGRLTLPTGAVVCADPMYREIALPQSWTAKEGNYSVYLYVELDGDSAGRIAYAELIFIDEIPKYWEMSLIPDQLLNDAFEKKMNGMYPVENGLSCFADYETFKIYEKEIQDFYDRDKDANFYIDVLEKYFKENANIPLSSRGEDWANYKPANARGNIIMFASGWGDGIYPRYVGYDTAGNIVKMITDFTHEE